ncbi:MAG: archaeosortase/exosortase family protein [Kiritimatiellae bacterium]|nr:archaeosortase/exosortase family protein [Kiritimatiellia bacterium]
MLIFHAAFTYHHDVSALEEASFSRIALLTTCCLLLAGWLVAHAREILLAENGIIHVLLALFFASLIFFRGKSPNSRGQRTTTWPIVFAALMSGLLALHGLVFRVRQFEWIGLLGVLGCALTVAVPSRRRNIFPALAVLYWAHPLPNQLLGFLQFRMQWLSTHGSELLLHLFNVRVWADGMTLRTPFHTYGIPEWCSGMRTATTVFIMSLGLALFKRLPWYQTATLLAVALSQALLLNILRIAAMVVLVSKETDEAGLVFLHRTTAVLVILAVLLVYLELTLWEFYRRRRTVHASRNLASLRDIISRPPPVLHWLVSHWTWIAFPLLAASILGIMIYRIRPAHRLEMIRDVALALRERGDLEPAQRAAELVMNHQPDDIDWRLQWIRILLGRGHYEAALRALDGVPRESPYFRGQADVLRAYALMGLDRLQEASAVVNGLPEELRSGSPQVALVLARLAVLVDDVSAVEKHLRTAARWTPNIPRIRMLYPYLRTHRRWETIVTTDRPLPHTDIVQALAACEAAMNLNDPPRVASILLSALQSWPDDPRLLEPLFFMARRGGEKWEERFADRLLVCLPKMNDPNVIYSLFERCFQISRPDLAWAVYQRIRALDSTHPGLRFAVARFGHLWFSFRKHHLQMSASSPRETYNIRPLLLLGRIVPGEWNHWYGWIPLATELDREETTEIRKQFLNEAIAEFRKRHTSGGLSVTMRFEFVRALEMAGDIDGAKALLDALAHEHPEHREETQILLSEILERKGDWQEVYECLRDYLQSDAPRLEPLLRLFTAQYLLNLGVSALHTARETFRLYPTSTQALDALASALKKYDSPEHALHLLSRPRIRKQRSLDILEAETLFATQRYAEANAFRRSVLLPQVTIPQDARQSLVLPPAEISLMRHRIYLPSDQDFQRNAETLRENLKTATNPFLAAMMHAWLQCYNSACAKPYADPEAWAALGRSACEKVECLTQLVLLLCHEEKWDEARRAAELATSVLPSHPLAWRYLAGLTGGDPQLVEQARAHCPDDPELWLASLVVRTQPRLGGGHSGGKPVAEEDLIRELEGHVRSMTFPSATMGRAGDYLYRIGMKKAASVAVRDAVVRARGLVPAYVLGVRCALLETDRNFALDCTRKAIEYSVRPPATFYARYVSLKVKGTEIETTPELIDALKNLRRQEPENPLWAHMLGYARFKRGGWELVDAQSQMVAAIQQGDTSLSAYTVAAESARLLGNPERAVEILRRGLLHHPNHPILLNNLAYTLSFLPDGPAEAIAILPRLLQNGPESVEILDTAATVFLRAGELKRAEDITYRILGQTEEGSLPWFRGHLRLAEIALAQGRTADASAKVRMLLARTRAIPDEDIVTLNRLREQLDRTHATSRPSP